METNRLRFRRNLRQASTPAEVVLWKYLRNRRLGGFKFRRQAEVGKYVVDFLNHDGKIIVEIDGDVHFLSDHSIARDKKRQSWLEGQGFLVLRYSNADIMNNLKNILEDIYRTTLKRIQIPGESPVSPHPRPLPPGEG